MKSIKATFEVKTNFDVSIGETVEQLLLLEQQLNSSGKLRYHLLDVTLMEVSIDDIKTFNDVCQVPSKKV